MEEEPRILAALAAGVTPPIHFDDDLHRRLMGALIDPATSALDLAVLVRQLLRRWALRDNRFVPLDVTPQVSSQLRQVAGKVGLTEVSQDRWTASNWSPAWLDPDGAPCDSAALAGTHDGLRFHEDPQIGRPILRKDDPVQDLPDGRPASSLSGCDLLSRGRHDRLHAADRVREDRDRADPVGTKEVRRHRDHRTDAGPGGRLRTSVP